MKKRILAALLLVVMVLSALAACDSGNGSAITAEEAEKIVLETAGLTANMVTDIHTHVGSYEDVPCFSVHITVDGAEYEYVVGAADGEILHYAPVA